VRDARLALAVVARGDDASDVIEAAEGVVTPIDPTV
jgi:hypothetical protein